MGQTQTTPLSLMLSHFSHPCERPRRTLTLGPKSPFIWSCRIPPRGTWFSHCPTLPDAPLPSHQRHRGLQKGRHPSLTREFLCTGRQRGHTAGPTGRPPLLIQGRLTPPPFPSAPWEPPAPTRLADSQCYPGCSPPLIYIIGRTQNAKFSDNPKDLIRLLDPVLFTHLPTWDDCRQLLQVLFTKEREQIQVEAQKSVLGEDRQPTQNPDLINAAFPLSHPTWDHNLAEGKERLRVYRQTLLAGLQAAAHKPADLAKVYDVRQGKDESPATFLEKVIEAFRQYTPMNPEAPETKAAIIMAFVNQAAPDIKRKLQRIDEKRRACRT
ncbi:uncharacterized protein LOC144295934 [Canis aureus]